jgi:hypothetical protein
MPTMAACRKDDPLLIAWNEYQKTEDFANTKRWAAYAEHLQGSLWAVFMAGYLAAIERAATLHESVNPASDDERIDHVPGAGAMGAVIQYRDLIRAR